MKKIKSVINDSTLSYPIISDSFANINNALDIWIKFTSYLKPEELLLMHELSNKEISSFSQYEMDEYYRIKKQIEISKLLLKYKEKQCTKEEYDQVVEFMHASLKNFVDNRITDEEKSMAKIIVSNLTTKQDLKEYIESNEGRYDSLNILTAYTLFIVKEKLYNIEHNELNKKIIIEKRNRELNLIRSLARDYGCFY